MQLNTSVEAWRRVRLFPLVVVSALFTTPGRLAETGAEVTSLRVSDLRTSTTVQTGCRGNITSVTSERLQSPVTHTPDTWFFPIVEQGVSSGYFLITAAAAAAARSILICQTLCQCVLLLLLTDETFICLRPVYKAFKIVVYKSTRTSRQDLYRPRAINWPIDLCSWCLAI